MNLPKSQTTLKKDNNLSKSHQSQHPQTQVQVGSQVQDKEQHTERPLQDACMTQYVKTAKLACAMAIIRTRPSGLTGQQYAEQLCNAYQKSQLHWKEKAGSLEEELLFVRQQLVKSQIKGEGDGSSEDFAQRVTETDMEISNETELFPTPPCSSQRLLNTSSLESLESKVSSHTEFLQAIINLRGIGQGASADDSRDENYFCTIRETIMASIDVLSKNIGHETDLHLSTKMLQETVKVIIQSADVYLLNQHHTVFLHRIAELLHNMLDSILKNQKLNQSKHQNTMCHLLLMFADSPHIRTGLLKLLSRFIANFSASLREAKISNTPVPAHLLENVYYIFWTLEQLLMKQAFSLDSSELFPVEVLQHLEQEMEESLLHISVRYPLYAMYVWKLAALLQQIKS